jgi:hypothetical protein
MRRLTLVLALLVAALGATLWLGPRFVDWEAQRARLAAIAAVRLGRPVAIEGDIRLALLPQPRVEASRVRVGAAGENIDIAARTMRLRLDFGALLTGRLEPREIVLVGAEIRLPWPPATTLALRPPPWLLALDARVEDGRVRIGEAVLENVRAHLTAGGALEAVQAEGGFTFRGLPVRFSTTLGRPGFDGVATLALTLAAAGASATAHGVVLPEGGFEGRMEVAGQDLGTLLPAPHAPFRGTGRLTAAADLLAVDELALDIGGVPARGAVALRLVPALRLDIALAASRIDLDAWIGALRAAGHPPIPTSLDLSAEAAQFQGVALRRLRGAAVLEDERLTLTDVSALLPGDMAVEAAGATAAQRLELALRFKGENLRETLAAFGLPVAATDPSRLRAAEGRLRLVLEGTQATVPELAATIDGARVSGAGVLRTGGARPALGLGLTFDRLDLDGLVPAEIGWGTAVGVLGAIDANLRIAAEAFAWRGVVAERATLDAALENGRLAVRRVSARVAGADLAASGALQPGAGGAPTRLSDLSVEVTAASAEGLATLLPGDWPDRTALATQPAALRITGGGAADAVALRAEADLGELRVEANGTLDWHNRRGAGSLTLRHPGAPRFLTQAMGLRGLEWLGEGSLSMVATLAASRAGVAAEHFDLVVAGLRAQGQMALALDAARPRLSGRILAERLPLPEWRAHRTEPLGLERLGAFDADLAVEAARLELPGALVLEEAAAALRLEAGRLRLDGLRARLGGGLLEGAVMVEGDASPPRVAAELRLTDATIGGPLFGMPIDLTAGRAGGEARLAAAGHSPAALLATLGGELRLDLRSGVLVGFDLGALGTVAEGDAAADEAALRAALVGGATAFDRLDIAARLSEGRATIEEGRLVGEGGVAATATGEIDLVRGTLDLRIAARPPQGEAPDIVLRLTGAIADPRRLPETAAWLRWRAERG